MGEGVGRRGDDNGGAEVVRALVHDGGQQISIGGGDALCRVRVEGYWGPALVRILGV
jgi:hypothetical protein